MEAKVTEVKVIRRIVIMVLVAMVAFGAYMQLFASEETENPELNEEFKQTQYAQEGDNKNNYKIALLKEVSQKQRENKNGTIFVIEQFEGYNPTVAPENVEIKGIELKLQYLDEQGNLAILKDENGEEITAKTNEKGVAEFSNIPYGAYLVYQEKEFENYSSVEKTNLVELESEEESIIVEKRAK